MAVNPFAPKPAGQAAPNPFAPKPAGAGLAAANPFAPKTGAPAPAANPFAAKAPAANPFAPKVGTLGAANPFSKPNPFAAPGAVAGANPFGATGATTAVQVVEVPEDPQDKLINAATQLMSRYERVPESDRSLVHMMDALRPFLKRDPVKHAFRKIVYNVRDPLAARPPLMTLEEWDREFVAGKFDEDCNPRVELMPAVLDGFSGLKARVESQEKTLDTLKTTLENLFAACQDVGSQCTKSVDRIQQIKHKQVKVHQRLLQLAATIDSVVLRNRTLPKDTEDAERFLFRTIQHLRNYLKQQARLRDRVDQLMLLHKLRADARAAGLSTTGTHAFQEHDQVAIARQLAAHHKCIDQLGAILVKCIDDLEVTKNIVEEDRLPKLADELS